jgi:hypothetical protein
MSARSATHHALVRVVPLALVVALGLPVLTAPARAVTSAPLSGHVVDASGDPVAGATITAYAAEESVPTLAATTTTDAAGAYALDGIDPEAYYRVTATPAADDPQLLGAAGAGANPAADGTLDLTLRVSNVRGSVTRSDGSPAGGALIELASQNGYGTQFVLPAYADGSYRTWLDPASSAGWQVVAHPPTDNPEGDVAVGQVVSPTVDGVSTVDLQLTLPDLRGRVLAPDGTTTAAGAHVRLYGPGGHVGGYGVLSGSDGSFAFSAPPGSGYQLIVEPPATNPEGWVQNSLAFTLADTATPAAPDVHDVTLTGATMTGVVRTPDGDPVPRAFVYAYVPATGNLTFDRADSVGHYGINVPAGAVSISLYVPRPTTAYLDRTIDLTVPQTPYQQDLSFTRPNVSGRVVTADGLAVAGATVKVSTANTDPDAVTYFSTLRDGSFALRLDPGDQRVVAVPPDTMVDAVRTATHVTVPGTGNLDGVELRLDRPTPPAYSLVPMPVTIGGQRADDVVDPVTSGDVNVVAVDASAGSLCGGPCTLTRRRSDASRSTSPSLAAYQAGWVLHDRTTGIDQTVAAPDGTPIDLDSNLALDRTGQHLAFVSADNIDPADQDYRDDGYVWSRDSGTFTRIEPDPEDPTRYAWGPVLDGPVAISEDGRTVAIVQYGENLDYDDTYSIVLVHLGAGGEVLSRQTIDAHSRGDVGVALSGDGSTLAWTAAPYNTGWWLHVLDLGSGQEDQTRSFNPDASAYSEPDNPPDLSTDGRYVAYETRSDVTDPAGNQRWFTSVHVVDRSTDTDRAVDVDGDHWSDGAVAFALSGDGQSLAELSAGPDLEDTDRQVWLLDVSDGTRTLVTTDPYGRHLSPPPQGFAMGSGTDAIAIAAQSDATGETQNQVLMALADHEPPTWPTGSMLDAAAADIGVTSVRLTWSAAEDNVAVTGYHVYRDGELVGTTTDRQLRVTRLAADTAYDLSVEALDGAGHESTGGPHLSVHTKPADTTDLRALDVVADTGGVAHATWEGAQGADAILVRSYLGDTMVDEQTLPADATTVDLTDLAAGTTYDVQVFTSIGGEVAPYTVRGSVTTPSLTISSAYWSAEQAGSGTARLGSTATLTALAEPGRMVTARVDFRSWYDDSHQLLAQPADRSTVVGLTEDPDHPGTYRASFDLVEGIARISAMTATVADGHGNTADRASALPPMPVSSRLSVNIDASVGTYANSALQVSSATSGASATQWLSGGGDTADFYRLGDADDYLVAMYDESGAPAAQQEHVVLVHGLTTALTLHPPAPAVLQLSMIGPDSQPVTSGWFSVLDDAGNLITRQAIGTSPSVRGLKEGQVVKVVPDLPAGSFLQAGARTITLAAGTNSVQLSADAVPRPNVSGVVHYDDGTPIPGATVRLIQQWRGQGFTFSATADDQGRYSVAGLPTTGTLSATFGYRTAREDVDLSVGPVQVDPMLVGPHPYTLRLRLYTGQAGSATEAGPIALDWRTDVHYGSQVTLDGNYLGHSTQVDDEGSSLLPITGQVGQTVRWCISGYQAHVRPTCVQQQLTSDRSPVIEMHAPAATAVTLRVQDASGAPANASVTLSRLEVDGSHEVAAGYAQGSFGSTIGGVGDYVAEAWDGTRSGQVRFSVAPGQASVDAGTIVLRPAGHFAGGDNAVTANRPDVPVGAYVEMRAAWRNTSTDLTDVTARITVPSGTELLGGSLLLDGNPVAGTPGDGYVDVPVGAVASGDTGVLTYRLRPGATAVGDIAGAVDLRHTEGGVDHSERLAPAVVRVAAVTIVGPSNSASTRVPLSGRAPAGNLVSLYDGTTLVGQAVTGPGGYWSTVADLPSRFPVSSDHTVIARTVIDGQELTASHAVDVDEALPSSTGISMYQQDSGFANGRRYTFDPRAGVARFPFVYVPGQPLVFDVTFDDPALVTSATILLGQEKVAATRSSDGHWIATYRGGRARGPIGLDFTADARPVSLGSVQPTLSQTSGGLPALVGGATFSDVVQPDGSSDSVTGAASMAFPAMGGDTARASLTMTRTSYTPTDGDLARARLAGVRIWDGSASISGDTVSASMVIPATALTSSRRVRSARGLSPAGVEEAAVRVGFKWAFNGTSSIDSLISAAQVGGKYDQLGDLVDNAASRCTPAQTQQVNDVAHELAIMAAAIDVMSVGFTVLGLALGPVTFGTSLAVSMLGWGLDKLMSAGLNQRIDEWNQWIDDNCEPRDPKPPVADPTWIYDPSGYAYEGARSQRVQGVTATLLEAASKDGPWRVWNAEDYGQVNPQTTDDRGRYGWDVPEGWWRVQFEKDGYRTAYSKVVQVLPPHLDLDVSMVRDGFPHVTSGALDDGRVKVTFDRLVRSLSTEQEGALQVVDGTGTTVDGTWGAAGPTAGDGVDLQQGLVFTPTEAPTAGTELMVTVDHVADYAGRVMTAPWTATFTVPATGGGGGTPPPGVPAAPSGVRASAGEHSATVSWTAPAANGSPITGYLVTVDPSGRQIAVAPDVSSLLIDGLTPGTRYTFTVAATNAVGTGPASDPTPGVTPTGVAPDTLLTSAPTDGSFVVSRTATLAWTSTGPAVASYACTLDGRLTACGSSLQLSGLSAGTHTFSVAARDQEGDTDATPASVHWTVPRDAAGLHADRWWHLRHRSWAYDRTVTWARHRGATLRTRVRDVRQVAVVVSRARHAGVVKVLLGRHSLGRFDLSSASTRHQVLLPVATFARPRTGVVRVVVVSRHRTVRIEGLGAGSG